MLLTTLTIADLLKHAIDEQLSHGKADEHFHITATVPEQRTSGVLLEVRICDSKTRKCQQRFRLYLSEMHNRSWSAVDGGGGKKT